MLSHVSEIPQLSPRCGIPTQVCLIPESSMLCLSKKSEKHVLTIHWVPEMQSSGGDNSQNAIHYNIRHDGMECKSPPPPPHKGCKSRKDRNWSVLGLVFRHPSGLKNYLLTE